MLGARRGTRSRDPRIVPWAKGRHQTAAPPRDPPPSSNLSGRPSKDGQAAMAGRTSGKLRAKADGPRPWFSGELAWPERTLRSSRVLRVVCGTPRWDRFLRLGFLSTEGQSKRSRNAEPAGHTRRTGVARAASTCTTRAPGRGARRGQPSWGDAHDDLRAFPV